MKVKIKTVEQVINPRMDDLKLAPELHEAIHYTFEGLDQKNHYNSKFEKGTMFFSNENWRSIARDIANAINN